MASKRRLSLSDGGVRLAILLAIVAVLAALAGSGVTADLFDVERVKGWVFSTGGWAPVVFAVAFVTIIFLFLPPTLMCLSSGFLFGPLPGLFISLLCVNIGGALLFAAARVLGREGIRRWLPPRLARLDERLGRRGLTMVVILRLTFLPFSVVSLSAGISSIRRREYLIGSFVGTFPAIFLFSWLGSAVEEAWRAASFDPLVRPEGFVALSLFGIALLFPFLWSRSHSGRSRS